MRGWRPLGDGRGLLAVGRMMTLGLSAIVLGALWPVASAEATSCQSGSLTFSSTGGEQCYIVPSGVSELAVTAVGGAGAGAGMPGGSGAVVRGMLAVTPGETLYVEVGANGVVQGLTAFGGGGWGGPFLGGAGGGASDLRTCSSTASSCPGGGSSLDSRLLVAGGGGGAGIGFGTGGAGGAAGLNAGAGAPGQSGTEFDASAQGGSGGGGGTAAAGGALGAAGSGSSNGTPGIAGSYGSGGNGGSSFNGPGGGGGGGGGGYFGGGGGGGAGSAPGPVDGTGGGGGGGSSFASVFLTSASFGIDTTGTPEVTIVPMLATVSVSPAAGLSFPGTQPQDTLSSPQTLTISNHGTGPLEISSLTFAGSAPQDFLLTSNGCMGQIAAGASCPLAVSFAPQAQGARTATLVITSNDPAGPASVQLSGTGGQLPTGATGPQGATGATGATGPQGPAGKVEVITCKTVTKTVKGRTRKVQKCTGRLVSGTVKFTATTARATLSRGRAVYARGSSASLGHGRSQLVLSDLRTVKPGRYTLTLRSLSGRHWSTIRRLITMR